MKKVLSTLTVLLLAGCSTNPNSMRSNSPDVIHSSVKSSKEIAICIADKWETFGVVNQREISGGFSLTASLSGNLHYLADIKSNGDATVTKAYKFMAMSVGADPYFKAISDCQI
ncbi:hypothetical protein H4J38_16740 [Colwellia sp. BRX10-3]|uniref:hypothetical protein n=1 Tax=Colwellia sp. BRX10-3 TaxID=2759844 RepID=UPI0015F648ED|nr:hypothetical protein [Colwellia sp. BRX10-3]MBA6392417.1 hypothetical protein [Colwellia sp. BRX10-3]